MSYVSLKLAKNQADAKQHLEVELFPIWTLYAFFIHVIIQKIKGNFLKNKQKNKCVCIHTINYNENDDEHEI